MPRPIRWGPISRSDEATEVYWQFAEVTRKNSIVILRSSLAQLHAARFEVYNAEFKLRLAQGLAATGQFGEAMTLVDRTMALIEANGNLFHMPEALRVKGSVLLQMPQPRAEEAEACFTQSLEWSRRQDSRSWELRTAVDLAGLSVARGRPKEARALLTAAAQQVHGGARDSGPQSG